MYTSIDCNVHGAIPLLFFSPCWIPFAPPSNPLHLLGNPPSCDRIRSPWSQVACKLTSLFSTLSPIPPPSKFPEPRLLIASLWRPQESGFFCPEQFRLLHYPNAFSAEDLLPVVILHAFYFHSFTLSFLHYTASSRPPFSPLNHHVYPHVLPTLL